jgi:hypothetical protein
MTYKLLESPGDLDSDWEKLEVGDEYHDCVSFHEMDFLYEYGKGKHSVYESNKFYFDHVDKAEFFENAAAADLKMTFEDWWNEKKGEYKGLSDWKDTLYTMDCKEKGNLATAIKTGASLVLAASALYM